MDKRNSIINFSIISGILISLFILILIFLIFISLFIKSSQVNKEYYININYLISILKFSFFQSILSTILSIILSILIALALHRRRFFAKKMLIDVCNMTLILPVLVAIIGILNIYGQEGWLSKIFRLIGIKYNFSPYGIFGIIFTHIFFNVPLGIIIFFKQLKSIPIEIFYLADSLNIKGWNYFKLVEWQCLKKKIKSVTILIFMLCFSSLTTIVTLGGGPKYTSIDVAILHALSYDYQPLIAAMLSILKMLFCLGLTLLIQHFNKKTFLEESIKVNNIYKQKNTILIMLTDIVSIIFFILLVIPPILSIIIEGLNQNIIFLLKDHNLWIATATSLKTSFISSILSLLLSILLICSIRECNLSKYLKIGKSIELTSMLIFSMPNITFATGLFLILSNNIGLPNSAYYLVIITNSFMTIPFSMKILDQSFFYISERYDKLCLSLNIKGWQRFKLIEFKALKYSLLQSLSISFILSIGDVNIISLFGSQDFYTLPFYLYQQLGSYQNKQATFTALLILIICILIFKITDKLAKKI